MTEETAFVSAVAWGAPGQYRFEVFSLNGDNASRGATTDVCAAIPPGVVWGCDNVNRRPFAEAAVRAAFPGIEGLTWETRSTVLWGVLPSSIAVRRTVARDETRLQAEPEPERLTSARVVTLVAPAAPP